IRDFHVTGVQTCALPIYRSRISSLSSSRSSFTANTASLILRTLLRSEVRYAFLTYCWVIVEPPWRLWLVPRRSWYRARPMPTGSDRKSDGLDSRRDQERQ